MKNCSYKYKDEIYGSKEELAEVIDRQASFAYQSEMSALSFPMRAEEPIAGGNPFYMRSFSSRGIPEGKNISIRPEKLDPGVYKFGEHYYRVSLRGLQKINEMKERPEAVAERSIDETGRKYAHMEDFFNNKIPMYIYDVKQLADEPAKAQAMADFKGGMKIKRGAPSLVTGKGEFDSYVTALADYITRLKDERVKVKGNLIKVKDLSSRIESQQKVLDDLKSSKSIRFLVETGANQVLLAREHGLKEDAGFLELQESLRLASSWKSITDIVDISRDGRNEEELGIINAARDLQNEATVLYGDILNKIMQNILAVAQQNDVSLDKVLDEKGMFLVRDIDQFGSLTVSGAFSGNSIEHLIDAVLARQEGSMRKELYDFKTERNEVTKELLGDLHASTQFMVEDYNIKSEDAATGKQIAETRKGLVTMYDRAFYDKMDSMEAKARSGEIKWKDYYAFEQQHFNYELTEEGRKSFEEYMQAIRDKYVIDTDADDNLVYDEAAIEAVRRKYDPQIFSDYLEKNKSGKVEPNSGATWFTKVPKNIPLNPNYEKLTDKEKKYHDWFSNTFVSAYENSFADYRLGRADIDQRLMDFSVNMVDNLGDRMRNVGSRGVEMLKDSVTRIASTTKSGSTARVLTTNEHISVPFKSVLQFLPKNSNKVEPLEVLTKFKEASIAFKRKREVEDLFNIVNDLVKVSNKVETNNAGAAKQRLSGDLLITKNQTNLSKRIEATVMSFLTDRFTDQNTVAKDKVPGERGFSTGQAIDTLNKVTRIRYMAWSPISATGNLLMACINNYTYAASGKYFKDKHLRAAAFYMKGAIGKFVSGGKVATDEAKMVAEIMYRHNMIGDVTEELAYGDSALNKLFILQKGGEFLAQGTSTLAQMLNTQVRLEDGTETNLLKLHRLVNGRLVYDADKVAADDKFKDTDEVRKAFDRFKAVNEKIHGDYSHVLLGKKTAAGRAMFLFRTWLPMAVKDRFGAEYEHRILGTQKGRYRSAWHLLKSAVHDGEGFAINKDAALDLGKAFLKLIPGLNGRIQLSDKISDIDRENIQMFVREVQMLIMVSMALAMAHSLSSGEDDDDDKSSFFKYFYNQGERIQNELSMFAVPTSVTQILQNVIPLTGTMVDAEKVVTSFGTYVADPEKDIYKRGFRKGDSKAMTKFEQFLPVFRSAQSTWSSFSQIYSLQPNAK